MKTDLERRRTFTQFKLSSSDGCLRRCFREDPHVFARKDQPSPGRFGAVWADEILLRYYLTPPDQSLLWQVQAAAHSFFMQKSKQVR